MSYLQKNKFALVAHRGGPEVGPENTIEAFAESLKIYPDFIFELDVHQTSDGEIVVMHDDTLERTTNGQGKIAQTSYSEILKLNAGFHTKWKDKNIKAPLLKEVFKAFPKSKITVEIKKPGYGKKVVDIIQAAGADERVVLSGFEQKALDEARRFAPHLCSGFAKDEIRRMLWAVKTRMPFIAPRRGDVFQIPIETNGIDVYSKSFLQLSHRLSKHVHVWTINDETTMRQLITDGADGIISDNPSILFKVAKELGKI